MINLGAPNSLHPDAVSEADIWVYFENVAKSHFGENTTLAIREIRDRMYFALANTDSGDRILGAQVTNVTITESVTVFTEDMLPARQVACPESVLANAPADCTENVLVWRKWSAAYNEGVRQCGGKIKMDSLILTGAAYKTSKGTNVCLLRYKGGNSYQVVDAGAYCGKKISIDRPKLLAVCPTLVPAVETLNPLRTPYSPEVVAVGKLLIGENEWGGNLLVGRVATASDIVSATRIAPRKYRFI